MTNGSQRYGELNWVAIIEAKTHAVLYLRAFVSGVGGLIFERDPTTSHGGPGPAESTDKLNPRRTSVTLPGLYPPPPPAYNQQALSANL